MNLGVRKIAAAIIFDTSVRLLLEQRDNIAGILYPGRIGLFGDHFGGRRNLSGLRGQRDT
jgi:hypothetical protein